MDIDDTFSSFNPPTPPVHGGAMQEPLEVLRPDSPSHREEIVDDHSQSVYIPQGDDDYDRGIFGTDFLPTRKSRIIAGSALAGGLLAILLGVILFGGRGSGKTTTQRKPLQLPPTIEVERGDLKTTIDVEGVVDTDSTFAVMGEVNGTVSEIYVEEGQEVAEGDPLLLIDNPKVVEELENAKHAYENTELDLDEAERHLADTRNEYNDAVSRYDEQYDAYTSAFEAYEMTVAAAADVQMPTPPAEVSQSSVSAEEWQRYLEDVDYYNTELAAYYEIMQAAADSSAPVAPVFEGDEILLKRIKEAEDDYNDKLTEYEKALDAYEKAEKNDERRTVKAPVNGTVVKLTAAFGTPITHNVELKEGEEPKEETQEVDDDEELIPLLQLSGLETIVIDAEVSDEELAKIERGQSAVAIFEDLPDQEFEAKVQDLLLTKDKDDKTVRHVRLVVTAPSEEVLPDMRASVQIKALDVPNVLLVPIDVVNDPEGEATVEVLVNQATGETEQRKLALGATDGDYVEVKGGLSEGDTVVNPNK